MKQKRKQIYYFFFLVLLIPYHLVSFHMHPYTRASKKQHKLSLAKGSISIP